MSINKTSTLSQKNEKNQYLSPFPDKKKEIKNQTEYSHKTDKKDINHNQKKKHYKHQDKITNLQKNS